MAVDYFLKIEGVPGESKDEQHTDWIDMMSWSWGESQSGTMSFGGGGGAGKVTMQDFHFVMKVNKASPKLLLACAKGDHIASATLEARKAGGGQQKYLQIKFTDLLVSSFQTGGSGGDELPLDQISLNYSKIEYEYFLQDNKGNTKSTGAVKYDLKLNKGEG